VTAIESANRLANLIRVRDVLGRIGPILNAA
jgi:hypothetical protein